MMATPDVTPVQRRALALAIGAILSAIGIHEADSTLNFFADVLAIGGPVLAVAWKFADAHIRHGRALGDARSGLERVTDTETHLEPGANRTTTRQTTVG